MHKRSLVIEHPRVISRDWHNGRREGSLHPLLAALILVLIARSWLFGFGVRLLGPRGCHVRRREDREHHPTPKIHPSISAVRFSCGASEGVK